MNKYVKYILTIGWILFSRSYDAYCSVLLTPDLKKEANPLVTVGGISSWAPLLIILSILTIYVWYTFHKSIFKPMNIMPLEKGYSFGEFISFIYLGQKDHWTAVLYKFPKDFGRLNQYLGQLLTKLLVYAGFVSTIMWLLIHNSSYYQKNHSAFLVYSILISGCIIIAVKWNYTLFLTYRRSFNFNNNLHEK